MLRLTPILILALGVCSRSAAITLPEETPSSSSFNTCPNAEAMCMDQPVVNCSMESGGDRAPRDRRCCPGLKCVPLYIPATATQRAYNTTYCVKEREGKSSQGRTLKKKPHRGGGGSTNDSSGHPLPPILPSVWYAPNGTSYNISNGQYGTVKFFFSEDIDGSPAIRTDFGPVCPFLQLFETGLNSNYGPCSVIFYKGHNYYIYPNEEKCCKYNFPAWHKTELCGSNASFGGYYDLEKVPGNSSSTVPTELWAVEWFTDFDKEPVLNIRNTYTMKGTNIPVRFREDLDTGWIDFGAGEGTYFGEDVSRVPKELFTDIVDAYPCHPGWNLQSDGDKTCVHYPASSRQIRYPSNYP